MSREKKERITCPALRTGFFSAGTTDAPPMELELDELEAMRLADLEELEQNEAAARMGVSRGTLQRLLYAGRKKVVFSLVNNRSVFVESAGKRNSGRNGCESPCRFCRKKKIQKNGDENMKIAVTSENGEVFQHFGHTPEFTVFEIAGDGRINGVKNIPTGECGHGALAGFLKDLGVTKLLCGGIGGGAQMALAEAGIEVVGGVEGNVVKAVGAYLLGELKTNPDFACHHHDGANHSCTGHCGHENN